MPQTAAPHPLHPHAPSAGQHQQQPSSPSSPQPPRSHPAPEPNPHDRNGSGFISGLLTQQLGAALGRRFGLEGRVDCYCSEGLRLVQWLRPLDPIQVRSAGRGPRQDPRPGAGLGGARVHRSGARGRGEAARR